MGSGFGSTASFGSSTSGSGGAGEEDVDVEEVVAVGGICVLFGIGGATGVVEVRIRRTSSQNPSSTLSSVVQTDRASYHEEGCGLK